MAIDISKMDGAALAFIGDAVYEIYVRKHVLGEAFGEAGDEAAGEAAVSEGDSARTARAARVDALHHRTIGFVNAKAQAKAIKAIMDGLSEEEQAIVRRARNHKPASVPKSADVMEYKWATAFEALVGRLWLEGKTDEMERVIYEAIRIIEAAE